MDMGTGMLWAVEEAEPELEEEAGLEPELEAPVEPEMEEEEEAEDLVEEPIEDPTEGTTTEPTESLEEPSAEPEVAAGPSAPAPSATEPVTLKVSKGGHRCQEFGVDTFI